MSSVFLRLSRRGTDVKTYAREQLEHAIDAFEVRGSQALVHLVVSYGLLDEVPLVQQYLLAQEA